MFMGPVLWRIQRVIAHATYKTASTNVLANGNNLGIIEQFLLIVQTMPLHLFGMNPVSF